jgi:hypothetical protein
LILAFKMWRGYYVWYGLQWRPLIVKRKSWNDSSPLRTLVSFVMYKTFKDKKRCSWFIDEGQGLLCWILDQSCQLMKLVLSQHICFHMP